VAFVGLMIALHEGLDVGKTVAMCLLHDLAETRSNDANWVHKRYVEVHDDEITAEQLGEECFAGMREIVEEYNRRESAEAKAAKDADLIDELLLLVEIAHGGNREAAHWLSDDGGKNRMAERYRALHLDISREMMRAAVEVGPTSWWKGLWTSKNRKD
jgi:putative hydrolase of HD superfamily